MVKKLLTLSLMTTLVLSLSITAFARVQYDSTGRYIVKDHTIRAQRKSIDTKHIRETKPHAAAAARIDYETALKSIEKTNLKNNHPKKR